MPSPSWCAPSTPASLWRWRHTRRSSCPCCRWATRSCTARCPPAASGSRPANSAVVSFCSVFCLLSAKQTYRVSQKKVGSQKTSNCSNSLNFEAKIKCNTIKPNVPKWRKTCTGLKFDLLDFMALRAIFILFEIPLFLTHPVDVILWCFSVNVDNNQTGVLFAEILKAHLLMINSWFHVYSQHFEEKAL